MGRRSVIIKEVEEECWFSSFYDLIGFEFHCCYFASYSEMVMRREEPERGDRLRKMMKKK